MGLSDKNTGVGCCALLSVSIETCNISNESKILDCSGAEGLGREQRKKELEKIEKKNV